MADPADCQEEVVPNGFMTTRWSVVVRAAAPVEESRAALETLCKAYWFPIYAYARKQGCNAEDAEDVTQDFLAEISHSQFLPRADPARGRFRGYLLDAVRKRIINLRAKASTIKRGGRQVIVSLDEPTGEEQYRQVDDPALDPAEAYERSWVLTMLQRVRTRLREEETARGKIAEFDLLEPFLSHAPEDDEYRDIAARLGIARNSVAVAIHRLGKRYRDLLRHEVAQTVDDPSEIDEELAYLVKVLTR